MTVLRVLTLLAGVDIPLLISFMMSRKIVSFYSIKPVLSQSFYGGPRVGMGKLQMLTDGWDIYNRLRCSRTISSPLSFDSSFLAKFHLISLFVTCPVIQCNEHNSRSMKNVEISNLKLYIKIRTIFILLFQCFIQCFM